MKIGIVGAEGAKFTPNGESGARALICSLLQPGDTVVSGSCHLGGVDLWAAEEAERLGLGLIEFPPEARGWEYYKARNILIARNSEHVVCIAVDRLPPAFQFPPSMKGFNGYCYHCKSDKHIKSGGCWTTKYARKIGVYGETLVVSN